MKKIIIIIALLGLYSCATSTKVATGELYEYNNEKYVVFKNKGVKFIYDENGKLKVISKK